MKRVAWSHFPVLLRRSLLWSRSGAVFLSLKANGPTLGQHQGQSITSFFNRRGKSRQFGLGSRAPGHQHWAASPLVLWRGLAGRFDAEAMLMSKAFGHCPLSHLQMHPAIICRRSRGFTWFHPNACLLKAILRPETRLALQLKPKTSRQEPFQVRVEGLSCLPWHSILS
ncbi:uncharacterized protein VTP21DRAFT_869 [Calcarisporiella thermophila]|uniref:uncharacterized protein n=1 Tax=Calcarisporiella thermophila TaxID=911321 RepID=UPI00374369E4